MTFRKGKTLAAALLCAAALTGAASAAYTDTAGHWAEGAIDRWSGEYGILRGYEDGSFRPDDTITRGAFAGILDRFLHYQAEAAPDTFSDTAGDYWESPILKLNAAGVYLGNNGKALIYHDITRQQAVIEDRGLVEIAEQNLGFDLAAGIRRVELSLDEPHYYLTVRARTEE